MSGKKALLILSVISIIIFIYQLLFVDNGDLNYAIMFQLGGIVSILLINWNSSREKP
ncbi:hypothetical protein HP456_22580 [Bacillus haikouensis]|jgi:hypothetical protein|uniref:hypothetical protein n=1 Tax=Bacillus haikouensis TaxID=1510468 RepID=UPI0015550A43|nr:hypothetical protein [Bacillus haikouensis]NQD68697.1 hypothetical protein [Bacillus haikouensis]